ncbi:MAG: putative subfamily polymerase sigma-24 subunit [Schumannella sp.]|nr:putative subfamily polymerase sigma-24 subunit [Schumannella sp.]
MSPASRVLDALLRENAPRVLGTLVRRHGQFEQCEDAVQEALIAAAQQWPREGVPDDPRAWLVAVAQRRLVDAWRSESARRDRERALVDLEPAGTATSDLDDTLALLVLCCHPALSAPSQLALTLRAVGGLTTAEIARAFLVPEATLAQRISRAKSGIKAAGARFEPPQGPELEERLHIVRHVLYLIFNEGYAASGGERAVRADLTGEAIRLTRMLDASRGGDPETRGLLALLLLTDARRDARERAGELIPLAEQDRTLWNGAQIAEGTALLEATLGTGKPGPYQVQAAIAALHDEAPTDAATDWAQILALYEVLQGISPSPVVALNRAVALARVEGADAGLAALAALDDDPQLAHSHRLAAVRAHLLERAGDRPAARAAYLLAARGTASLPEQRYLNLRAAELAP